MASILTESSSSGVVSPRSSKPLVGGGSAAAWLSSSSGGTELDERVVAKAALDAAEDALESLCAVHAGTFVAVEKRGQRMETALTELQASIASVQAKVQDAQTKVWNAQQEDEPRSLAVLSEKHRVRRRTLLQHSALLELLELPSLMDACVRSNLYEEALGIASLANTLERRRFDSSSSAASTSGGDLVVGHVVNQIRSRQEDLRRHLLHRLEGNVTMPDCLEVVTALRRLNSIDLERTSVSSNKQEEASASESERLYRAMEVKLQIDFLEARNVWLDTAVTNTSTTSGNSTHNFLTVSSSSVSAAAATEDMLDTIERYRTRVFEVATQFNAIFRANSSIVTPSEQEDAKGCSGMSSADLLALWTCRRIHAFLQVLKHGIQQAAAAAAMESTATTAGTALAAVLHHAGSSTLGGSQQFGAATLRDWLEATIFFSSSMGRLGADFTAHSIPIIFEDALVQWIVQHCWIQQGVKPLQDVWAVCHEANVATPLVATGSRGGGNQTTSIVAWSQSNPDVVQTLFSDFVVPETPEQVLEQTIGPLRVLMQVPPLGRFVNAILNGLNELRRCLLPSALPRLLAALESEILQPLTKELKQMERQCITTPGKDRILRELIANEYVPLWNHVVLPYCRASLWTAIGRGTLALQEYRKARSAIDEQIAEKREVIEAALKLEWEKQLQEEQAEEETAAALAQKQKDDEDAGPGKPKVGAGQEELEESQNDKLDASKTEQTQDDNEAL